MPQSYGGVYVQGYGEKGRAEREFRIASAATSYEEAGNPVYPPARRKLAEHGIGCAGHAAHRMTPDEYGEYDLIVCMTRPTCATCAA